MKTDKVSCYVRKYVTCLIHDYDAWRREHKIEFDTINDLKKRRRSVV